MLQQEEADLGLDVMEEASLREKSAKHHNLLHDVEEVQRQKSMVA